MELSTLYRERTLDRLSEDDIGKVLKVAGWVENIRDHGGVSFIDLRVRRTADRYEEYRPAEGNQ